MHLVKQCILRYIIYSVSKFRGLYKCTCWWRTMNLYLHIYIHCTYFCFFGNMLICSCMFVWIVEYNTEIFVSLHALHICRLRACMHACLLTHSGMTWDLSVCLYTCIHVRVHVRVYWGTHIAWMRVCVRVLEWWLELYVCACIFWMHRTRMHVGVINSFQTYVHFYKEPIGAVHINICRKYTFTCTHILKLM